MKNSDLSRSLSRRAYRQVQPESRLRVMRAMRALRQPRTANEIVRWLERNEDEENWLDSHNVRTRLIELEDIGLIRAVGTKVDPVSKRQVYVYEFIEGAVAKPRPKKQSWKTLCLEWQQYADNLQAQIARLEKQLGEPV